MDKYITGTHYCDVIMSPNGVSNHQPHDCLLNRLFMHTAKKTSKLRVTGLCARNSLVTGEFLAQMSSNAENISIWWRHHVTKSGGYNPHKTTHRETVYISGDFVSDEGHVNVIVSHSKRWCVSTYLCYKYLFWPQYSFDRVHKSCNYNCYRTVHFHHNCKV